MKQIIILITLLITSCSYKEQNIEHEKKLVPYANNQKSQLNTATKERKPELKVQTGTVHLCFPSDKEKSKSYNYGSNNLILYMVDELTKEIEIKISPWAADKINNNYSLDFHTRIPEKYTRQGYKFYWISSESCKKTEIVVHKTNYKENDLPYDEYELYQFLKNLNFNPKKLKNRFKYQNELPIISENETIFKDLDSLTLEEYYKIFQEQLQYRLYSLQPYYFLSYIQKAKYYQFYIYQYVDSKHTSVYLIHLGKNGEKLFSTTIWSSGGDGGYSEFINFNFDGNRLEIIRNEEVDKYAGNGKEFRSKAVTKYTFNNNGTIKHKELTSTETYKK